MEPRLNTPFTATHGLRIGADRVRTKFGVESTETVRNFVYISHMNSTGDELANVDFFKTTSYT